MKQKLAITRALLHEPRLLFLDEPTSGLDPESAHLVREFIINLHGYHHSRHGWFFGQVSGLFVLNTQLISIVAFVMLALDVLMICLASQVFDRESILTRWR